jgi:hypothetical protein
LQQQRNITQMTLSAELPPFKDRAVLLDRALAYARRGWSMLPVAGKKAAGLWKPFQAHPADEKTLRRLFAKEGITGLAVVLGRVSGGLAVRDFDRGDAYHRWASAHPDDAARQPTVRTARGFHVYGTLDADCYATLDDGELRADPRHYVLVPPSLHPSGSVYGWTIPLPEGTLPPLPASLIQTQHTQPTQADAGTPRPPTQTQHNQTSIAWWTSAIAGTLPRGPGERNRCIFELARRLKAKLPQATATELRALFRKWHRQALPFIGTKDFGESWADLAVAWERIRRPAGQSFAAAAAAADTASLPPSVEQLGYDGPLRRLAALCWQLAQQWGDRPFPLGCEIAGKYLGVSVRHAGRLLKALRFDGVLELVAKGNKRTGKASEWRFIAGGSEGECRAAAPPLP